MNMKRSATKISERNIPYFPRTRNRAFCPRCDKPVDLVRFDEAAAFYKTQISDITALSETGDLHRIHNSKGEVLICSDSLFAEFDRRETRKLDMKLLPHRY